MPRALVPYSKDSESSASSSCQSTPHSPSTTQKWQPVQPWSIPALPLLGALCFRHGRLHVPHLSRPAEEPPSSALCICPHKSWQQALHVVDLRKHLMGETEWTVCLTDVNRRGSWESLVPRCLITTGLNQATAALQAPVSSPGAGARLPTLWPPRLLG